MEMFMARSELDNFFYFIVFIRMPQRKKKFEGFRDL